MKNTLLLCLLILSFFQLKSQNISLSDACIFSGQLFTFTEILDGPPVRNQYFSPAFGGGGFHLYFEPDSNRWEITFADKEQIVYYSTTAPDPNPPTAYQEWRIGTWGASLGCGMENDTVSVDFTLSSVDVCSDDTAAPQAQCKNTTVFLNEMGTLDLQASQIDDGSLDACTENLTFELDTSRLTCENTGALLVTMSVTDEADNTSSCTSTLMIADSIPPTAACLPEKTVILDDITQLANISANDVNNNSADACGIDSISVNRSEFSCADIGSQMVQLTVVDLHGNSATCQTTIKVEESGALPQNFSTQSIGKAEGNGLGSVCLGIDGTFMVESRKTSKPFIKQDDWNEFTYLSLSGDFNFEVEILDMDSLALAGLMVRSAAANDAVHAYVGWYPPSKFSLEYGSRSGAGSARPDYTRGVARSRIFSISRTGNTISLYNGGTLLTARELPFDDDEVKVGFFVSSRSLDKAQALFGNVSIQQ